MLVGRKAELRFLDQYYEKEGNQLLVVYGAKGVGKTTLLNHFCLDKPTFYYAARSCSSREQRYQWRRELTDLPEEELLPFPSYRELLSAVVNGLPATDARKGILVLEDFHYLVKGEEDFFTELLQFLKEAAVSRKLLVILCSSASGWVENNMVRRLGAGAMALSGLLKLRELKVDEMRQLYPGYSKQVCMQNYAVLGGVPGLWNCFEEGLSLEKNLIRNLLSPESSLYHRLSSYMDIELREAGVYNTILAVMAGGSSKLNDIYKHTGFSRAKISVYLKNLMELELVEKVRSGNYRIVHPGLRFYFRFLFPYKSLFVQSTGREFYEKVIKTALPGFLEEAYAQSNVEELE